MTENGTFQSSLLRNFFCKSKNPKRVPTPPHTLSILVTEELLLQEAKMRLVENVLELFQSSLLRNFFCKDIESRSIRIVSKAFNPRYWGTSFASVAQGQCFQNRACLSILVTEELLLQVWHGNQCPVETVCLSILVTEELLLQEPSQKFCTQHH